MGVQQFFWVVRLGIVWLRGDDKQAGKQWLEYAGQNDNLQWQIWTETTLDHEQQGMRHQPKQ